MVVRGFLSRPAWPDARLRNFIWMSAAAKTGVDKLPLFH